jgi:hypothetical protein
MLSVIVLSVAFFNSFVHCQNAEYPYAMPYCFVMLKCCYAECHYAKCQSAL